MAELADLQACDPTLLSHKVFSHVRSLPRALADLGLADFETGLGRTAMLLRLRREKTKNLRGGFCLALGDPAAAEDARAGIEHAGLSRRDRLFGRGELDTGGVAVQRHDAGS